MDTIIKTATGAIAGFVICFMFWRLSPVSIIPGDANTVKISYSEFVSILLTAVSVILAALGFVVALLAFVGWNAIGKKASESAKEFIKDSMKDGGELHTLVKDEAKEMIYAGIEPVDSDFEDDDRKRSNS